MQTIKKLLLVSRPISWLNTAYPFAAGYIVTGGTIDGLFILATVYFLVPYNLLMYGVNDIFDYESDIRNPRKGGIEGMREQRKFHPVIAKAVIATNIPIVGALLLQGNGVSKLVLLLLIFFVVAYSLAWLRFKERPVLDSITSSIHFVGPLLYALSLTQFDAHSIPYVIAFFLWGVASHALGAIQDIIPDRKAGIASTATIFGARRTIRLVAAIYFLAALLVAVQNMPAAIIGAAGMIYIANLLPYLNVTDSSSYSTNTAWRRFIWLNLFTGFIITLVLIWQYS